MPILNLFAEIDQISRLQKRLGKTPPADLKSLRSHLQEIIRDSSALGSRIPAGAKILDVGCGLGDSVQILMSMGYDASGVDIIEYWNRGFESFWEDRLKPQGAYLEKLHLVECEHYRFPFPDASFDFAFSSQLFEHVFNCEDVFREIARVLKPGGISLHVFPGPNMFLEGHINVPLPFLCHWPPYLYFWALMGRRSLRQGGFSWKETVASNMELMNICRYPTKRQLFDDARRAEVHIEFVEIKRIQLRDKGRLHNLLVGTPKPFRSMIEHLATWCGQRSMLIHGLTRDERMKRERHDMGQHET